MNNNIKDLLSSSFKNYKIQKLDKEASYRKYYRLHKDKKFLILMDSSKEPSEFSNFLKVHDILSRTSISIPKIYEIDQEKKFLLLEDFGDLRFDKILDKYKLKELLSVAVESLIVLKKEINFDLSYQLPIYNYDSFLNEISEFTDYFYPYYQKKKNFTRFKRGIQ